MEPVVVVGGGQAGIQAADSLRTQGFDGDITIVANEAGHPYQRPQLSKEFLKTTTDPDPLVLRTREALSSRNIETLFGAEAQRADIDKKVIHLADGRTRNFEHLVIATGSRNRRLDVPGAGLGGIHSLRTLVEAYAIRKELFAARNVVVVGAGFVGLEIASAARSLRAHVTVLDLAERPMARILSTTMSEYFADIHRNESVVLQFGTGVTAFEGDARVQAVVDCSGKSHPADLVVVGVGAQAETSFAAASGIEVSDNGVAVEDCLNTDIAGIWAIGDCANFKRDGKAIRLEAVQNAMDQGKHVAQNIVAGPTTYSKTPWFWTHQFGYKLQIAGLPGDPDAVVVRGCRGSGRFSTFCFNDGMLRAVESVGKPADHMAARRILAERIPISAGQASDERFDLKGLSRSGTAPRRNS